VEVVAVVWAKCHGGRSCSLGGWPWHGLAGCHAGFAVGSNNPAPAWPCTHSQRISHCGTRKGKKSTVRQAARLRDVSSYLGIAFLVCCVASRVVGCAGWQLWPGAGRWLAGCLCSGWLLRFRAPGLVPAACKRASKYDQVFLFFTNSVCLCEV